MQYKGSLYVSDQVCLKRYKDKFKFTYFKKPIRQSGFEIENKGQAISRDINEEKLDSNLSRAKQKIFEYAYCNEFQYFVTLTLDKEKLDRYDLACFKKKLREFIKYYKKKNGCTIQYVLVPEQHKDGAWHMHGLIKGIPREDLYSFDCIEGMPYDLYHKDYYCWKPYFDNFGFCSMGVIKSQEAVSKYMTKYIRKSLGEGIEKEKNTYLCSRGLKTAIVEKKGFLSANSNLSYDFENDFVMIKWLDKAEAEIIKNTIK